MPGPISTTDPILLERHCRCRSETTILRDASGYPVRERLRIVTGCPLHDPHPRHDLPESI